MYVSLGLLADDATERLVLRLAGEVGRQLPPERSVADALAARLPAHVSLKQPFRCDELAPVLRWCDGWAARTRPVEIELTRLTYGEHAGHGIVGIEVVETPALRGLHNQINAELARVVADASAPFDGDAYRFHLTVAMLPIADDRGGQGNPCRAYYDSLADTRWAHRFTADRLALAICRAPTPALGAFRIERVTALIGAFS